MYEQAIVKQAIRANREITFYTRNGDWFAVFCIYIGLAFAAASAGMKFYRHVRANQEKTSTETDSQKAV
jgi:apolipoprotein N-acyltransferase